MQSSPPLLSTVTVGGPAIVRVGVDKMKGQAIMKYADITLGYVSQVSQNYADDPAHAREVARQLAQKAASYQRSGWTQAQYAELKSEVYDAVHQRCMTF